MGPDTFSSVFLNHYRNYCIRPHFHLLAELLGDTTEITHYLAILAGLWGDVGQEEIIIVPFLDKTFERVFLIYFFDIDSTLITELE